MNGETQRDYCAVDLIEARKDLKNKAQKAGEQGGCGKKQRRADGPAFPKDRNRRKQHQRHGQRGHLENVLVPINRPMGGGKSVNEEAAGKSGEQAPSEGEEGEGPAGIPRRSKIEDRRSSEKDQQRAIEDADGQEDGQPTGWLGALGRLGAAIDDLLGADEQGGGGISLSHLHCFEV